VHPAAGGNVLQRIADGNAIADDGLVRSNADQCHLVALRHAIHEQEARGELGACSQAAIVGNDGDVVALVHANGQRGRRHDSLQIEIE
jgi:hypothetical protein